MKGRLRERLKETGSKKVNDEREEARLDGLSEEWELVKLSQTLCAEIIFLSQAAKFFSYENISKVADEYIFKFFS